ncbi:MAG TPA: SLAC1 anion channel family protein [Thiomonas arsenitoxydans]|uniref:SLAC1 anion channel family protein n=1 Tax=Thiomonas TaxID=32012 RepID=UPI00257A5C60|nr:MULTISPECIES: SLAC1 anion channel family protein [Thiomonas]HML83255.1 SLAC1 anion channel family protein [Thiomonas arsenitoxydans]
MARSAHPRLKFLAPGWFAVVLGWGGLALAWHQATALLGEPAAMISQVLGWAAIGALGLLALLAGLRLQRHASDWLADVRHPVRHSVLALVPMAMLVIAGFAVQVLGANNVWMAGFWMFGALAQLAATVWVFHRLRQSAATDKGSNWAGITPALFLAAAGNVVVPFAGVALGFQIWSVAQWTIGALFFVVVQVLFMVRVTAFGRLPRKLLPMLFITVAPPAAGGLGLAQLGAPVEALEGAWGIALFFVILSFLSFKPMMQEAFTIGHWALSFPLAAFAGLSMHLALMTQNGAMQTFAILALALASVIIGWLTLATARGLRDGSLLAPEPVALIHAA